MCDRMTCFKCGQHIVLAPQHIAFAIPEPKLLH
jgi:hypothetical protein